MPASDRRHLHVPPARDPRGRRFAGPAAALVVGIACSLPQVAGAALPACPAQVLRPVLAAATDDSPVPGLVRTPANDVGCILGVPLQVETGTTLWRCLIEYPDDVEPAEDAWSYALLLVREGQPTVALRDELMAGAYDAWHVLRADLDADGTVENVVATWNAQGNGLGVNTWTVRVFAADWTLLAERGDVLDWGPPSLVQAPGGRSGCDVALTSWVEDRSTGIEGIAFEARFERLQDGALVPAADRPPLRRRYLNSFERERTASFENGEHSFESDIGAWLRDAR